MNASGKIIVSGTIVFFALLIFVLYPAVRRLLHGRPATMKKGEEVYSAGAEEEGPPGVPRLASRIVVAVAMVSVAALAVSIPAVFMRDSSVVENHEHYTATGAGFYDDCALLAQIHMVETDISVGHPPANTWATVDSVVENHKWVSKNGVWELEIGLLLRGYIDSAAVTDAHLSSIYIEIGTHNKGEKDVIVKDAFSMKRMERGSGPNEWGYWKPQEQITGSDRYVSILEIHPVARAGDRVFKTLISCSFPRPGQVAPSVIYIDPCDFGQKQLRSVSGTLSWPMDIRDQKLIFASWAPEEETDSPLGVPERRWSEEPLDDLKVWAKGRRALEYKSIGTVRGAFAFLYNFPG